MYNNGFEVGWSVILYMYMYVRYMYMYYRVNARVVKKGFPE